MAGKCRYDQSNQDTTEVVQAREFGSLNQATVSEHSEAQKDAGYVQKVRMAGLHDGFDIGNVEESVDYENDLCLLNGTKALPFTAMV